MKFPHDLRSHQYKMRKTYARLAKWYGLENRFPLDVGYIQYLNRQEDKWDRLWYQRHGK